MMHFQFCFVFFKKELNSRDGAWDKICTERDPFILCNLMWSWIEQLKEPIISTDDVDMLAKNCTESQDALYLLRKVDTIYVSLFFNCQVYFVNLCQTIYLWPLGKRIALLEGNFHLFKDQNEDCFHIEV